MSEDEEIEEDIDDVDNDELKTPLEEVIQQSSPTQPVEVIKEETVTVVRDPKRNTSSESISTLVQEETQTGSSDDENIYEQLKAQSIQINRLTDIVELLQSQIKQLQETRLSGRKTTAARRKNMKTKKKAIGKRANESKKK
jgi:hypothetical protein